MPPESVLPLQSLTAARVVVVAGKGGVGKTTVTAVIARAALSSGRRVLVVELDGKPTLAELLPGVEVMAVSAPAALDEYLHQHGLGRIAKGLNRAGVIDVVGTAAPGIDDIVVLGKIKHLEQTGDYDLIVVDGPAAGHAISFLNAPAALVDTARSGPVREQAEAVLEMLRDADRCQVVLVTLPETTPVNEVIETESALVEAAGVQPGVVVINGVDIGDPLPESEATRAAVAELDAATAEALADAAAFRRARRAMEADEIARLAQRIALPRVVLAACSAAGLVASDINALAAALDTSR